MLVWLEEPLGLTNQPFNANIRLYGCYDRQTGFCTIYLVVDLNNTEYRCCRLHSKINDIIPVDTDRLRHLHRNMIADFVGRYKNAKFSNVIKKFLSWSTNPIYSEVLSALSS